MTFKKINQKNSFSDLQVHIYGNPLDLYYKHNRINFIIILIEHTVKSFIKYIHVFIKKFKYVFYVIEAIKYAF